LGAELVIHLSDLSFWKLSYMVAQHPAEEKRIKRYPYPFGKKLRLMVNDNNSELKNHSASSFNLLERNLAERGAMDLLVSSL